jgi:hypothetical protein
MTDLASLEYVQQMKLLIQLVSIPNCLTTLKVVFSSLPYRYLTNNFQFPSDITNHKDKYSNQNK